MSTLQSQTRRGAAVVLVWIAFALPVAARAQPAAAELSPQPAINPQVAAVVEAMSDRVAQARAFSFRAVMVREELGDNGQILDAVTDYRFEIERPNRLRAAVRTEQADLEPVLRRQAGDAARPGAEALRDDAGDARRDDRAAQRPLRGAAAGDAAAAVRRAPGSVRPGDAASVHRVPDCAAAVGEMTRMVVRRRESLPSPAYYRR